MAYYLGKNNIVKLYVICRVGNNLIYSDTEHLIPNPIVYYGKKEADRVCAKKNAYKTFDKGEIKKNSIGHYCPVLRRDYTEEDYKNELLAYELNQYVVKEIELVEVKDVKLEKFKDYLHGVFPHISDDLKNVIAHQASSIFKS